MCFLCAASHFAQYGIVATSNVSRAVHNTMKKNFGFVNFKVRCIVGTFVLYRKSFCKKIKLSFLHYTINKSRL